MGFKLNIIKATELDRNIKCTIHKTGKLGFTKEAARKLNIDDSTYIKIGINEDDSSDKNLYLIINRVVDDDGFKVSKAGAYFYANTKGLFDKLKVDYKNNTVMYDITDFEHEGMKLYKMTRRDGKKKTRIS